MKNKLIFFEGVYDTLDLMSRHLQEGFRSLGYDVLAFDVRKMQEFLRVFTSLSADEILCVISFNNLGMNMQIREGFNLWNDLQIPFVNILVDHPFHYHESLVLAPDNAIILCIDENHVDYIRRFYPNINVVDFLAHGGTDIFEKDVPPIKDRPMDVFYAGSLSGRIVEPKVLNPEKYTDIPIEKIWDEVLAVTAKDPSVLTENAIESALIHNNIHLDDNRLRELLADFRILDYHVVTAYRERILKTLVCAGTDVTIYGSGWDKCEWINRPNCHYFGKIPVTELLPKMQQAKIVLNTMTWFKRGSHERIMNGMLAGAVVVTDESSYILDNYENNKELLTFSLNESDALPEKLRSLLADPAKMQQIAGCGRIRAKKSERWENRAEEIHRCLLIPLGANPLLGTVLEDNEAVTIGDSYGYVEDNTCTGCGACKEICPTGALQMEYNEKGFLYPYINEDLCIHCGLCKKVCPRKKVYHEKEPLALYAARMRDCYDRLKSQSGGASHALVLSFLREKKGIVYGVALKEDEAGYIRIDNENDASLIRGSKYVQTNNKDLFSGVEHDLQNNLPVLCIASPCIIGGLLNYLHVRKADCSQLYAVDILCHGAVSPGVFKQYIELLNSRYGKISDFKFRDKAVCGWHSCMESFIDTLGHKNTLSLYAGLFNQDVALRESCYSCQYAGFRHQSDLVLGDCWGSEQSLPDWMDETGISLICVNTDKGKELMGLYGNETELRIINRGDCIQPILSSSSPRSLETDEFWFDMQTKDFAYTISKYSESGINAYLENAMKMRMLNLSKKGQYPSDYIKNKNYKIVALCGDESINRFLYKDFTSNEIRVIAYIDVFNTLTNKETDGIPIVPSEQISSIDWSIADAIILTDTAHIAVYIEHLINAGIKADKIIPFSAIVNQDV